MPFKTFSLTLFNFCSLRTAGDGCTGSDDGTEGNIKGLVIEGGGTGKGAWPMPPPPLPPNIHDGPEAGMPNCGGGAKAEDENDGKGELSLFITVVLTTLGGVILTGNVVAGRDHENEDNCPGPVAGTEDGVEIAFAEVSDLIIIFSGTPINSPAMRYP